MLIQVVVITFVAVFFIILAVYLWFTSAKESPKAELKRRLRRMAKESRPEGMTENLRSEILKETPPVDQVLLKVPFLKDIDRKLDQAGLHITPARFLAVTSALAGAGFFISFVITRSIPISLIIAVILLISPFIYLAYLKKKRINIFTELFPDALTMIARSLRAGHSFTSAIQLVGQEISDPVGSLFKTAYDQQLLGLRLNDALTNMNERMDSLDLRFFTTAVGINTEVGGNLAEILDKLAETIRERIKIRRQIRVYTAQGRMSGYTLAVLPIVAFILFNFILPGYEQTLLKERLGIYVLIMAAVLQLIGFLVIRKIINIRI